MKAKDLAKILLKYPDLDVEFANYSYQSPEDSVGSYDFVDADIVSLHEATGKRIKYYPKRLILSGSIIGYPEESEEFKVIT